MSKRLSESVKLIEKAYRRKMKKKRQEGNVPTFENLGVDFFYSQYPELVSKLKLIVVNLLDDQDPERYKRYESKIISTSKKGSAVLVASIKCPICGEEVKLAKHWNSFICTNSHKKMIFEIFDVYELKSEES